MMIPKAFLTGLLLLATSFFFTHHGLAQTANALKDAGGVAAMEQAGAGFAKLADLAARAKLKGSCGTALAPVAHQVRMVRADVDRSGETFSDLAAISSSQGQQSGLYGDAMDSLTRLAATVDDIFLLTAEMIVACADPEGKAEAAELKEELAKEARAAADEALQAAKLQKAYLLAYGD